MCSRVCRRIVFAFVAFTALSLQTDLAFAQGTPTGREAPTGIPTTVDEAAKRLEGLGFGLGISMTYDLNRRNGRLGAAELDANKIVRVTEAADASVGFVLETHYFLHVSRTPSNWSWLYWGPFAAVEIGSSGTANTGPITGYALGLMLGLRRYNEETGKPTNNSWNFGVGLRIDPRAKSLGDGIYANQPLPANETVVRVKTEPRYGLMVMSSFGF